MRAPETSSTNKRMRIGRQLKDATKMNLIEYQYGNSDRRSGSYISVVQTSGKLKLKCASSKFELR